jgi:Aminotransferase class I and II
MSVRRLAGIPGFNIDRVAAAAGDDPDVLRMENLDTDLPPPVAALEATRAAIGEDDANSWLPFTGRKDLQEAVAAHIQRRGGPSYDAGREIVITGGEGDAMLDSLLCLTDPGDEVILTDPTYAGMVNRGFAWPARFRAWCRCAPATLAGGSTSARCVPRLATARGSSSSTTRRFPPAGWRATTS